LTQTTRYASVLPKIGAEKSSLLSEVKLKTLSETKNLTEVTSQLRDTPYQEQISRLMPPITGRHLERAFYENLIETYLKIIKYSPERVVSYLNLYLSRFESENVKTLIRVANAKLPYEQRLSRLCLLVEKYFKKISIIEDAAKAPTISQVILAFKNTEYFSALSMGLKSYEESGSPACLDIFIDTLFYDKLYAAYEGLPKKEQLHAFFYASIENDSFILLSLLRGKNLNYDPNWLRLAVPKNYFNLNKKEVESIVSAIDFKAAYKIVQDSHYAKFFESAQTPEGIVANAEKAFRKAILLHAKKCAIRETFNIGSTLNFITLKEAEVHNLTALSLGIEAIMKPEMIRNQLLL